MKINRPFRGKGDSKMKGRGSSLKLCEIADVRQIRSMTTDSRFSCAKCGSKAHESRDLCDPVPISGN